MQILVLEVQSMHRLYGNFEHKCISKLDVQSTYFWSFE